ncbi:MAG: PQQ-binding-like beta-propeller repeat protein [bacterium]
MKTAESNSRLYYRIAYVLAIVSVSFSVVVAILMVSSLLTVRTSSPLNLTELDQLRASLRENPTDDAVKAKIRDLDLVARRFYFAGLTSLRTGSYLLLAGVALALACLKTMVVIKRRLPDARHYPPSAEELESSAMARFVIAGTAVAIITGAIVVGLPEKPVRGTVVSSVTRLNQADAVTNWPGFRGSEGSGVSICSNLPVSWDIKTGSNILWRANVPLPGMSSPVVWGNRVFVTGASDKKREVYCYDLATGIRLWAGGVESATDSVKRPMKVNGDTGFAASTPVVDGAIIYSIFANGDVAAIDFCAQPIWITDLGIPENKYGYSASLAQYGDRILVQFDADVGKSKKSQLIALDAGTGRKAWSVDRPVPDSWPTPVVVDTESGPQLLTVAQEWIIAYNPGTGKEIWRVKCGGSDVAPTPIYAGGLVIAAVSHDKVYAIRPNGRGDVSATHVAWRSEDGVSDVASPVSDGELIFLANSSGTITCLDVKNGKVIWDKSSPWEFYASPGLAGGRLYLVARNGEVIVLKAGRKYEEIGKARLGEPSDCSPAFVNGRILMRGATNLFCIGTPGG